MSKLLVSVVQSAPPLTPTSAPPGTAPSPEQVLNLTLQKLDSLLAEVARQGSGFAVLPEAFVGGYPKYSTFGATLGDRQPPGRSEYLNYFKGAIPLPPYSSLPIPASSPLLAEYTALSRILATAARWKVFVVMGVIERAGGTLYCTLLSVHPQRGLVGKRRKLLPTGTERVVWGMGEAEGLGVEEVLVRAGRAGREKEGEKGVEKVNGQGGVNGLGKDQPGATGEGEGEEGEVRLRFCKAVCWENYMPLLRTHFYTQSPQLYCAPTVDSRPAWTATMQHIALESRCFVLSACQFSTTANYAPEHPPNPATAHKDNGSDKDGQEIVIAGGSCIISPLGEVLAGPLRGREGVLTAEVDLEDVVRGRMDLDVVGHYARQDVFELRVHTRD